MIFWLTFYSCYASSAQFCYLQFLFFVVFMNFGYIYVSTVSMVVVIFCINLFTDKLYFYENI